MDTDRERYAKLLTNAAARLARFDLQLQDCENHLNSVCRQLALLRRQRRRMLIKLDGLRADQQRGVMVVSAKSADGMLRRLLGPKIHDEVKKLRNANRREELNSIIKLAQKGEDIYKLTPGRKRAIEARVANLKLYQGDAHRSTGLSRVMLNKLRKLEPLMPEPEVGKEP